MILHKNESQRHKNHPRSMCQDLHFVVFLRTVSPWQAGPWCVCEREYVVCVCVYVHFEVSCHAERMMKRLSAPWNTSAAPFSHALCLFKVTYEKGICIGKRNSECNEPCCSAAACWSLEGRDEKSSSVA